ncbi:MAG: sodium:solute symporter family protein [Bdellovibrionales bacterium]|nr:sodium:solute symporter family protein [Bdellovibrionales bacterium]
MNFSLTFPVETLVVVGVVLGIYFVGITGLGLYFSRFSSNITDFFFSGRRFAWWLPMMSMVATGIGGYSYLKYSEQGFNTGMSSTHVYFNDWFLFPVFLFAWLPILYFNRIKSIPEYFEKRFNSVARYLCVFIILAYIFYYIGYNLFTIGVAIEGIFGIPALISLPVIAVLLGVYVTLGGQTAVIFTDLFQGMILYLVGFLVIGCGLYALGGIGEFWSYLPIENRLPLAPFNSNPRYNTTGIFWGDALAGGIAFLYMNQGFLMRFMTIRNVTHARMAALANLMITLPLSALVIGGLGWVAKSILSKQAAVGGALSEGYSLLTIDNSYHTFLLTAYHVIQENPWIMGFVFSALMAALMSTVDSLINAAAAIGIYDIYKPLIRPKAPARHYLKMARFLSLTSMVIGLLLVIWFYQQKGTLMSIHYKGIMLIIPPVVTTVFLGILWRNFHAFSACVSMLIGIAVTFLTMAYPQPVYALREFLLGPSEGDLIFFRAPFGIFVTALAGVVTQSIFPKADRLENISGKSVFRFIKVLAQGAGKNVESLTADTLKKAMFNFKGGEPSLKRGKSVRNLDVKLSSNLKDFEMGLSQKICDQLCVGIGDLIYLADQRWYLGGIRSGHFKLKEIYPDDKESDEHIIYIAEEGHKGSYLVSGRKVFLDKNF